MWNVYAIKKESIVGEEDDEEEEDEWKNRRGTRKRMVIKFYADVCTIECIT